MDKRHEMTDERLEALAQKATGGLQSHQAAELIAEVRRLRALNIQSECADCDADPDDCRDCTAQLQQRGWVRAEDVMARLDKIEAIVQDGADDWPQSDSLGFHTPHPRYEYCAVYRDLLPDNLNQIWALEDEGWRFVGRDEKRGLDILRRKKGDTT